MTNWILHFPLVLFSRLCPADNPSHGTEESLLSKLRPFPNHWHGQTWTALGHQRCVGDSGFPRITWCQHRHKVQDETSTQLHLWEAFSIKKRYFRVSAWQGQVENLNWNSGTEETVQAKYFITYGSSLEVYEKLPLTF